MFGPIMAGYCARLGGNAFLMGVTEGLMNPLLPSLPGELIERDSRRNLGFPGLGAWPWA